MNASLSSVDASPVTKGEGAPLLAIRNLSKRFGGVTAVNDVSFDVRRGEILAVVGPNGAGKTTLFGLICGFIEQDSGTVRFDGEDVSRLAPHVIAKRGLVRSFQIVQIFPDLTVHETVVAAAMLHHPLPAARRIADELLVELDLAAKRDDLATSLPIQSRKRLELAKCVATQPKLIILDEVMAGLTLAEAEIPIAAIRKLRDRGITFLMVEHVMPVVLQLADRMLVLNFGEMIMEGTPSQVMAHPDVQEAYLGESLDA
ncbi:MAG: ABC transporter ATP-binding protein [Rhizobiales bacterium]|nr:ABC transporter ATP-binding protein [Hyphomicrobiales bacterium]